MVNLELYKIFITVAKEGNITKASEILNISQPAVTKHIKNLESQLNTILFSRIKGMQLTENGKKLYDIISNPMQVIQEAENSFLVNRNINFGTYPTMLSKVLSNCIAEFYENNQNSKITAVTEFYDNLVEKLLNGDLDIILVKKINENLYNSSKIKYITLGNTDFVVVANNKSNLRNKVIDINDLKGKIIYIPRGETSSSMEFVKILRSNNFKDEIKKIDSVTMLNIIEKHDCIGLVNKNYIKQEIEDGKVTVLNTEFKIPPTEFGIYVQRNNMSSNLNNFIKILKNEFKNSI